MINTQEIQLAVNNAYLAIAQVQYALAVREPVSGDTALFDAPYTLSTKLVANLEYINTLSLGHSYVENTEIESIVFSLTEITSKIKTIWR